MAADPLTLASVTAVALSEGIKFLYGQASEILKRWTARREGERDERPVAIVSAGAVAGQLEPAAPDWELVARLENELYRLRAQLNPYYEEIKKPQAGDERLLDDVDALRRTLEAILGQPITLQGEQRPVDRLVVTGEAHVKDLLGKATGVEASGRDGHFAGRVDVDVARSGSEATGTKFTQQP
jgi:hypothetical protein